MQFEQKKRLTRSFLQWYYLPPIETISLQEFEELAFERLKILKVIETAGLQQIKGSNEYKETLRQELKNVLKNGVLRNAILSKSSDQFEEELNKKKDNTSHHILKLAFSKTEDQRRWFITQEVDLFRYRFQQLTQKGVQEFLKENNLVYNTISSEEREELLPKLLSSSFVLSTQIETELNLNFYKVHFTEVPELVRNMKIFLKAGMAYVPQNELAIVISNLFRNRLSRELVIISRGLYNLSEQHRLLPLLSSLSMQYMGEDYSNSKTTNGEQITRNMIDGLSRTSFPLCMQQLHQSLRQNHHLKYHGRLQYGLFLKGIGLSLDEALNFWRLEFTKIMDPEKFSKEYAYNIRYNYGKEGKRTNYTPYSCIKIITTNQPGVGDSHGCPFRHSEVDLLKQRLKSTNIQADGLNEILNLVKHSHYQLACGRYFELKNNSDTKFNPQHPNEYFEESQKVRKLAGVANDEDLVSSNAIKSTQVHSTCKVKLVPARSYKLETSTLSLDSQSINNSLSKMPDDRKNNLESYNILNISNKNEESMQDVKDTDTPKANDITCDEWNDDDDLDYFKLDDVSLDK